MEYFAVVHEAVRVVRLLQQKRQNGRLTFGSGVPHGAAAVVGHR